MANDRRGSGDFTAHPKHAADIGRKGEETSNKQQMQHGGGPQSAARPGNAPADAQRRRAPDAGGQGGQQH